MSAERLFGTDGVRGIAGLGNLSDASVARIGAGIAAVFRDAAFRRGRGRGTPRLLLGRDTRVSGRHIEAILTRALVARGVRVERIGILPTPAVAILVGREGADGGIVISASHNPSEYNGIKVLTRDGTKLPDRWEREVESVVRGEESPVRGRRAVSVESRGARDAYVGAVEDRCDFSLSGMTVVADCAHGAAAVTAPEVLKRLGAAVIPLHDTADGRRINENAGALHPEVARREVLRRRADVGISFDGDADRVILTDHRGGIRDGDYILAIAARHLLAKGRLPGRTVVATVLSNIGLERSVAGSGGRLVRSPVGDREVYEKMRATGAGLGGEQSGHVIFMDYARTGDGLWTALSVLGIMAETGKSLAALARCMRKYPQTHVSLRVRSRPEFRSVPGIARSLVRAEKRLGADGRVVLRYSGTEPVARLMVEGPDRGTVAALVADVTDAVRRSIGA